MKNRMSFWLFFSLFVICLLLLHMSQQKTVPAWVLKKPTVDHIKKAKADAFMLNLLQSKEFFAGITIRHDSIRNKYKIPTIEVRSSADGLWDNVCFYSPDSLRSECLFVLNPGVRLILSYNAETYTLPFSSNTNENELSKIVPIVWYDEDTRCLRDYKGKKIPENVKITITLEQIDQGILYKDDETTI